MAPPDEKPEIKFIQQIAEALCQYPEDIKIVGTLDERGVLLKLTVAKEDLGRIIGKGGENATAIRLLLRALGSRHNARYALKVDAGPYSVRP